MGNIPHRTPILQFPKISHVHHGGIIETPNDSAQVSSITQPNNNIITCLAKSHTPTYRVFHFEVSISALRLDLGSKSQQILTVARAKSICDFQPLDAKARAMLVDFSNSLDVKPVP
jgi:hypothetical protein